MTDELGVDRLVTTESDETHPVESLGRVRPRMDVVQEAWRRNVGFDLRTPEPARVRQSPVVRR